MLKRLWKSKHLKNHIIACSLTSSSFLPPFLHPFPHSLLSWAWAIMFGLTQHASSENQPNGINALVYAIVTSIINCYTKRSVWLVYSFYVRWSLYGLYYSCLCIAFVDVTTTWLLWIMPHYPLQAIMGKVGDLTLSSTCFFVLELELSCLI